ncbi:MAG: CHAT domain-containing protein, partial [Acidobacteriota bacterium]
MTAWRLAIGAVVLLVATLAVGACKAPPPSQGVDNELGFDMTLAEAEAVVADPAASSSERGRAHRRLGQEHSFTGRLQQAVEHLEIAEKLFEGDPVELALTLNILTDVMMRRGEFERQGEVAWQALDVAAGIGDARAAADAAASAWNNLGVSFAARGQPSGALEGYQRSLELNRDLDNPSRGAATRHNLGVQLLLLGRVEEGVAELRRAVATRRQLGESIGIGTSLASLAWGEALSDRPEAALEAYAEAEQRLSDSGAVQDLAIALEQRAQLLRRLGRFDDALADLDRARELQAAGGELPPLLAAYLDLGHAAIERQRAASTPDHPSDLADAIARLRRSVATFDGLDAQDGRIMSRLELARALRSRGGDDPPINLEETEAVLVEALGAIEAARSDLRLPSFRATFLGGWQSVTQELVDLLASAAVASGDSALAERALEAAERGRARALLDRLAAGRTQGAVAEGLVDRVETLEAQTVLEPVDDGSRGLAGTLDEDAETRRDALRQLRFALERAQEIAQRDLPPTPAATPAAVDDLREELDDDDVLLVYALGLESSWLWRVEQRDMRVFELSAGETLETSARKAHELLPMEHQRGFGKATASALERLAHLLLAPLAEQLEADREAGVRLLVVPDGALHLVPFGVLPRPGDNATPLIADHEIVHLPSASTLVALRQRVDRAPAEYLLALVADPVFEADDERFTGRDVVDDDDPAVAQTRRAFAGQFGRLVASADEARRIADLAEEATGVAPPIHLGFDARRELVTRGELDAFRILHFATHGIVDAEDPALAGLVLSLYGEDGLRRDGLLRTRDLYPLRLGAELVVLSACRTALGQEIRGEGLVGLADAFFAAGANQLVVSLWDVEDRPTAELMVRFYRHLLLEGRSAGEALRRAQLELRGETE